MRPLSWLVILLAPLLAGCLREDAGTGLEEGHDCIVGTSDADGTRLLGTRDDPLLDDRSLMWDHDSYNVRTCSLPALGVNPLHPSGVPHKYIGEIDFRGDLNLGVVAVLGNQEAPRVYILNISDRAQPRVIAHIDQAGTYIVDVKLSDDGKILYTASQGSVRNELVGSLPNPKWPSGFTLYNIQDPTRPRYIGSVLDANGGCHMLSVVQVSSVEDAVFCVSTHVRAYLIERGGTQLVNKGFVDYIPQGSNGLPTPALPLPVRDLPVSQGPHDMTVFHEGGKFRAGKSYMVVSHWGTGVRVIDITEAPVIREVGAWTGQGAKHWHGNVHTAMMFQVGGHRYIVASPELTVASAKQVPSFWVLDADNLANLRLVGEWYHPNEHPAQGLYQTIHQWQVAPTGRDVDASEVRVYLTYNHAGVWVLDFSKMLERDMWGAILGFNMARKPLVQEQSVPNAVLSTWDVAVVDGYMYGSDRATGLWTFHFEGDRLGDTRLRGFA